MIFFRPIKDVRQAALFLIAVSKSIALQRNQPVVSLLGLLLACWHRGQHKACLAARSDGKSWASIATSICSSGQDMMSDHLCMQEKKPAAAVSNEESSVGGQQPAASAAPAPVANGNSSAPEANPYAFLPDPRDNHKVCLTIMGHHVSMSNNDTASCATITSSQCVAGPNNCKLQ